MNAPLLPEILGRRGEAPQADLPLASGCVLRYIWESRYGHILIEVVDGRSYVNGQLVEPAEPSPAPETWALP